MPKGTRHKARKGISPGGDTMYRARQLLAKREGINVAVFVLDRSGKALMPCSEKRARLLLARGRARVHRILPFMMVHAGIENPRMRVRFLPWCTKF